MGKNAADNTLSTTISKAISKSIDWLIDFKPKGAIVVVAVALIITFHKWLMGGHEHQYRTLNHCMDNDTPWIAAQIGTSIGIMIGYMMIAYFWHINAQGSTNNVARRLLTKMMYIFIFCSFCGYGFDVLNNFYPMRRLQVILKIILLIVTWLFLRKISNVRIVFSDIHVEVTDKKGNALTNDNPRERTS